MKNDRANERPSLHASLNWSFLLLSSWLQEKGDRDPMLSLAQQVVHLLFSITKKEQYMNLQCLHLQFYAVIWLPPCMK